MYQQSYIITVEREEAYKTRRERAQKRMLRAQRTGAIQGGTLAVLVMVLLMLVFARGYCGLRWNISKGQFVPKNGYTCPHCQDKLRRGLLKREVRHEK